MLIDYSIRAFEILERKLTVIEKEEVLHVFYRLGNQMEIAGLPKSYNNCKKLRKEHLKQDLDFSDLSQDLFHQYRKHLGLFRYLTLIETQSLLVPLEVKNLFNFKRRSILPPFIHFYKFGRIIKLDGVLKTFLLPPSYKTEIEELDTWKPQEASSIKTK